MGPYVKAGVLIIVLLLLITFGVKNSQPTQLTYYFHLMDLTLPLYVILYSLLLAGILIGMLIGLRSRLKYRKMIKALQQDIFELKKKIIDSKQIQKERGENNP